MPMPRPARQRNACGIWTSIPAPSPVSASAATALRCARFSSSSSALRTISAERSPFTWATKPMPHPSCSYAASYNPSRPKPPMTASVEVFSCAACAGHDLLWVDEWHLPPQLAADVLDGMRRVLAPATIELWPAVAILFDPRRRKGPVSHFLEELSHRRPRIIGDDARSGDVVAVLGGIRNGVAHVIQSALVEEVDDQFQLVHALEVRDLGLITRFDEGVEAGFHQRGYTPTEHRLFAE